MGVINFSKANCRNCYKCLRSCPVKAIRFNNEQAEIDENRCIACGHCLVVCPQNARNVKGDLQKVKQAIKLGGKVAASVAPSFSAAFLDEKEEKVVAALRKLGFSIVEETALGADLVAEMYGEYMKKEEHDILITTCCPSADFLVEKYFPQLIPYMIPVVSPMIAHGKILKKVYGKEIFTVFVGPCVSKKIEALDPQYNNAIDAVLTFEELTIWLEEEGIVLESLEESEFDRNSLEKGKRFPLTGGVISSFIEKNQEKKYKVISVSGMEECMEVFKGIEKGEIKNVCVEVSACKGSCIGGPGMPKTNAGLYKKQQKVAQYIKNKKSTIDKTYKIPEDMDFSKEFSDKSLNKIQISENKLKKILKDMGKFEPEDELNCGVCGYNTCREKAQAISEGMAEINMCLHYMRNKAESLTNIIFENTPNIIIIVDEDMKILEFNPVAEEIFMVKANAIKGKPLFTLMDDRDFVQVKESGKSIVNKKIAYPQYNVVLIQDIVYVKNQNIILGIMANVMSEEKNKKELVRVKENTLKAAQEVIEKQMRVAQEIASLLGETTAETKVILTKLRKIAMGEDGEGK